MFRNNKNQSPDRRRSPKSAGTPVYSYYSSRTNPEVSVGRDTQKTVRSTRLNSLPTILAIASILVSLSYILTLDTNPRIVVNGDKTSLLLQPTETYRAGSEKKLKSSIVNRSKLFINVPKVESDINNHFHELNDVAITIPVTGRRPIINIVPVRPALILVNTRGSYVLDKNGIARAVIDDQEKLARLNVPIVDDESDLELNTGKSALPGDQVRFVTELIKQFELSKTEVEDIKLPLIANEIHIKMAGEGYVVKFNLRGDPRLQAGTYIATREQLAKTNIKPAEYIDVRVEEKAFYR